MSVLNTFDWSNLDWNRGDRLEWSVMTQALEMGMPVAGLSRKRLRKRMRQMRRHWDPYKEID